jgi:hypothetical protein
MSQDGSGSGGKAKPNPWATMPFARKVTFWAFASLVILAAVFYLWWGFSFGVWVDNGEYSVFITLLLFGLAGMWLVSPSPPVSADDSP